MTPLVYSSSFSFFLLEGFSNDWVKMVTRQVTNEKSSISLYSTTVVLLRRSSNTSTVFHKLLTFFFFLPPFGRRRPSNQLSWCPSTWQWPCTVTRDPSHLRYQTLGPRWGYFRCRISTTQTKEVNILFLSTWTLRTLPSLSPLRDQFRGPGNQSELRLTLISPTCPP